MGDGRTCRHRENVSELCGFLCTLPSERDAYIYSEAYIAVHPDAKEGLKKLNQFYNDGLITPDFPADTSEDQYKADMSNGKAAFTLADTTQVWEYAATLNTEKGIDVSFVPVMPFELPDGSYRTPFEYRYAMFVMIPATVSDEKAVKAMQYLNWMADPEVAVQIRHSPDLTYNSLGVAVEPTSTEKEEKGYPGTLDDLCIMTLNFAWVNDWDVMSQTNYETQEQDWATVDWYRNYYDVCNVGKFRYPTYGYIPEAEATYGASVKSEMIQFVYTVITASDFESAYTNGMNNLNTAHLQDILDQRGEYYDSIH